jgi:rhodanese-related sulfurtransferase
MNMENENSCNIRRWDILKRQLKNLAPASFLKTIQANPNAILVDVRTPTEFDSGSLPNAINMDFLGLDYWDIFESLDRRQPVFVFCRSSRRSVRTAMFMKNGGFQEVYNLEGGLNALGAEFPSAIVKPVLYPTKKLQNKKHPPA